MLGPMIGYGALSAIVGSVLYANLPTRYTIGNVVPTVQYLAKGVLRGPFNSEKDLLSAREVNASDLFKQNPATLVMVVRRPGCSLCRHQAGELSQLSEEFKKRNVGVVGVLHEAAGADQFHPYLKDSQLYFDEKKHFYGPEERWLPIWMGALRLSSYWEAYEANKAGFKGDMKGEGRLLGGVYLIKGNEMLYSHLEKQWGDRANLDELRAALKNV